MSMPTNLISDYSIIGTEYAPVAYVVATLSLATHIHPIQALQYVFSNSEYLTQALLSSNSINVSSAIIQEHNLMLFGELGDLSEDPNLIGHMESLATAIGTALDYSGLSLDEMNSKFEEQQLWELIACVGKSWVANGIEWSTNTILGRISQ